MPPAVRLGDMCSGHHAFKPRPNDQGSPDVFVNNLPSVRVGDHWVNHGHSQEQFQVTGAPTVFVNNRAKARVGDLINCGSINAQGSPNVIVGSAATVKPGFSGGSFSQQFADVSDIEPTY